MGISILFARCTTTLHRSIYFLRSPVLPSLGLFQTVRLRSGPASVSICHQPPLAGAVFLLFQEPDTVMVLPALPSPDGSIALLLQVHHIITDEIRRFYLGSGGAAMVIRTKMARHCFQHKIITVGLMKANLNNIDWWLSCTVGLKGFQPCRVENPKLSVIFLLQQQGCMKENKEGSHKNIWYGVGETAYRNSQNHIKDEVQNNPLLMHLISVPSVIIPRQRPLHLPEKRLSENFLLLCGWKWLV